MLTYVKFSFLLLETNIEYKHLYNNLFYLFDTYIYFQDKFVKVWDIKTDKPDCLVEQEQKLGYLQVCCYVYG